MKPRLAVPVVWRARFRDPPPHPAAGKRSVRAGGLRGAQASGACSLSGRAPGGAPQTEASTSFPFLFSHQKDTYERNDDVRSIVPAS